jgi:hypothetical protein
MPRNWQWSTIVLMKGMLLLQIVGQNVVPIKVFFCSNYFLPPIFRSAKHNQIFTMRIKYIALVNTFSTQHILDSKSVETDCSAFPRQQGLRTNICQDNICILISVMRVTMEPHCHVTAARQSSPGHEEFIALKLEWRGTGRASWIIILWGMEDWLRWFLRFPTLKIIWLRRFNRLAQSTTKPVLIPFSQWIEHK